MSIGCFYHRAHSNPKLLVHVGCRADPARVGLLLALTGCRRGEVLALRWEDVDLEGGVLRLPDAKAGARTVALGASAATLLAELPRNGKHVVHSAFSSDRPLSCSALEDAWDRIRTSAKIPDARLHDLRHTVGTYGGQAGLNAFMVRDLLGHKTLAMTGRYVQRDLIRCGPPQIKSQDGSPPR
ncbi:MAG TPA: site-specific integrase [Candidatus Binatia bacterium]